MGALGCSTYSSQKKLETPHVVSYKESTRLHAGNIATENPLPIFLPSPRPVSAPALVPLHLPDPIQKAAGLKKRIGRRMRGSRIGMENSSANPAPDTPSGPSTPLPHYPLKLGPWPFP
ncbi:hypothetical protein LBMAG56_15950 [Verrucomicrobiota bacterium]|nr:hypothetical protein LBMAG56_15950 [Verrucomicrobiota bacterium]